MGHWKKLQQEQDLGHRSDVDLKDKWRNIVKSVKANKQMRGVVLGPEDIARVQVLFNGPPGCLFGPGCWTPWPEPSSECLGLDFSGKKCSSLCSCDGIESASRCGIGCISGR